MAASRTEAELPFFGPERDFPQERARRTYEALIAAAADVFAERGFDNTQTPDIAAAAGVSVGTFYRYFADKMEVFLESQRRQLGRYYREVMARLTPENFVDKKPRAVIEDALAALLANTDRSPDMQRVFLEMAMRDERVAELKRAFDNASRQALAEIITTVCGLERVPDPEATAFIIYTAVLECALAIAGGRGSAPIPRDRALAALSELCYRAVFGSGATASS